MKLSILERNTIASYIQQHFIDFLSGTGSMDDFDTTTKNLLQAIENVRNVKRTPLSLTMRMLIPPKPEKKKKAPSFTSQVLSVQDVEFKGETFVYERDQKPLMQQLNKLESVMIDGKWRTYAEMAKACGCSDHSMASRMSDMVMFRGWKKERRIRECTSLPKRKSRIHEFRVTR